MMHFSDYERECLARELSRVSQQPSTPAQILIDFDLNPLPEYLMGAIALLKQELQTGINTHNSACDSILAKHDYETQDYVSHANVSASLQKQFDYLGLYL